MVSRFYLMPGDFTILRKISRDNYLSGRSTRKKGEKGEDEKWAQIQEVAGDRICWRNSWVSLRGDSHEREKGTLFPHFPHTATPLPHHVPSIKPMHLEAERPPEIFR